MRVLGLQLLLILLVSFFAKGYPFPGEKYFINKFDKEGRRQGRWVTWYDDEHSKICTKGRYKHGNERGRWKYYADTGVIQKSEKYKRRGRLIRTAFYHPNGQVQCNGVAMLEIGPKGELHYYWEGNWNYYSDTGKLTKTLTFSKGKQVQFTGH